MAESQENPNVEEQEEEECPKCPPKGAPAWMATFADMATLLMAFFVLILSFAEFNVPKFKQISGSLKNAFGIQRVVPVVEQPRGTTVLALNFSPSPEPSVTKNMTQQSTNTEQKNLDLKSEEDTRESSKSSSESIEKAKKLEEALKSIDLDKSVSTEVINDKVVVKITIPSLTSLTLDFLNTFPLVTIQPAIVPIFEILNVSLISAAPETSSFKSGESIPSMASFRSLSAS